MTKPSRQFLIQQATLNACNDVWGGLNFRNQLRMASWHDVHVPKWFKDIVIREYRKLDERYM